MITEEKRKGLQEIEEQHLKKKSVIEIENKILKKRSQAKRINLLLKKAAGRFRSHYELKEFEEPVVLLMRKNNTVEFYEKATTGAFVYTHSSGKEQSINLTTSKLMTFA